MSLNTASFISENESRNKQSPLQYSLVKLPSNRRRIPQMSESIRAVDRALDILVCFTRQTPQLTMTQIADQVGLNKSTVHRLLGTLEKKRFLQRDPSTGLYQLGIRLLQIAYLTLEQNDLRRLAAPFLHRLCEEHRETVTLSILDDSDVVFLDVVESPQRVKLAASIGQRLPAFATAAGKAILAYISDEAVKKVIERGMQQYTPQTIHSQEIFFQDLNQTRKQGFSIAEQEYEEGINAVAAPILNLAGQPVAAITVTGPAYRLSRERMNEIGSTILETAREIAIELGQ
jgi:DNA-binding IclR family transcriptional regulator